MCSRTAWPTSASVCAGVRPSGDGPVDARLDLVLQRGNPNLEELIEVGCGDRAELRPLQQGNARLGRELQDSVVEREPAQFTVEESFVGHCHGTGAFPMIPAGQTVSSA